MVDYYSLLYYVQYLHKKSSEQFLKFQGYFLSFSLNNLKCVINYNKTYKYQHLILSGTFLFKKYFIIINLP